MKIQHIVVLGTLMVILAGAAAVRAQVDVRVSANFSELNDYGDWVVVPGYGTVWRPFAAPEWRPFTYGHWVYTSDGWVWDSDEPFGWVVCHYGYWYYDDDQGWVWLPGYDWSPARVRWYVTDNEIGWAPMFPQPRQGFPHNNVIYTQWTFSPTRFFAADEVHNHMTIRSNPEHASAGVRVYTTAPRKEVIQRVVGAPIASVKLDKVSVTTHEKPLVRVQVQSQGRPQVEVPIGPKYKRFVAQSKAEPAKSVTVTHEQAVQPLVHQEQSGNAPTRAAPSSNPSEQKVRKRPRDDQNNQRNDQGDNNRGKNKEEGRTK
jgi:hypothetical protein